MVFLIMVIILGMGTGLLPLIIILQQLVIIQLIILTRTITLVPTA